MSDIFGVNFICSNCAKSMGQCNCNPLQGNPSSGSSYVGNSSIYGICANCGNLLSSCICNTAYRSSNFCKGCGNSPGFCCCTPGMNPIIQPSVSIPYTSSTASTSSSDKYDCRIFDIITKEKLDSCGQFILVEAEDKIFGMYGQLSSFELPIEFESCFYHLRNDYKNLWQMRTPLTFRINIERDEKKEVKFFALIKFYDIKNYEDRLVVHDAEFQEIRDNLEVTRLVEIQRIFTKLLRRI